jgi:hypothetical protein
MSESEGSPPPRKGSKPAPKQQNQPKNVQKYAKAEKVEQLPKRRSYDIQLPAFLAASLLKNSNVPLELREVQLKIVLRSKD